MPELEGNAVMGNTRFWLYRTEVEYDNDEAAWKLSMGTASDVSKTRSTESLQTNDGTFRIPQPLEVSGSGSSIYVKGDPAFEKMEEAMNYGHKMHFWMIDAAIPHPTEPNKYRAQFFKGYLTDFTVTNETASAVQISESHDLEGHGVYGYATLTQNQVNAINEIFIDTAPKSEANAPTV